MLYIKSEQTILTNTSISVFDIFGRKVYTANYKHINLDKEKILNLSVIKSGVYFLTINNEKVNCTYIIIKE